MNCRIEAWLDHGDPCVRITDADTGRVCLHWTLRDAAPSAAGDDRRAGNDDGCDRAERTGDGALQRLVRELFLLACMDRVAHRPDPTALHPLKRPPGSRATAARPASASER